MLQLQQQLLPLTAAGQVLFCDCHCKQVTGPGGRRI
jgi:hypothetical protein